MTATVLTLISKPGCHLCDAARDVINSVIVELESMALAPKITLEEKSIFDNPELLEKYAEEIPVLLLNGQVHNIWRIDRMKLRAALLEV